SGTGSGRPRFAWLLGGQTSSWARLEESSRYASAWARSVWALVSKRSTASAPAANRSGGGALEASETKAGAGVAGWPPCGPEALCAGRRKGGRGDGDAPEKGGLVLGAAVLVSHLLEEACVEGPGIVDQDVEATEPLHRGRDGSLCGYGVGDVQGNVQKLVVIT